MVRTTGKHNKMVTILFLDHGKTNLQNIWYFNVFSIPMFSTVGIRQPDVSGFLMVNMSGF